MLKLLSLVLFALTISTCGTHNHTSEPMIKKAQDPDKFIIGGHIVEKEFIKKNGEPAGFTELYFRASIQDYFIKFCESSLTASDLMPYVDQVVTVHAEIRNGNWDICKDDPRDMQSRIGDYMIIKELR